MNPIQATVPDDQNVVEFSESPGRRLRVHRQSKGLEIARVAAQLHLRPSMVEALEHDQYENLPNPVFVAGYLRNYARVLGLDPEPIVASYRAANPSLEPPPPRVTGPGGPEIGSGHILVRLISLALIAGVIAMLALWWQNRADLLSMSGAKEDAAPGLAFSPGDEDQGGPSEGPGTGASEQSPAVHAGSAGSTTAGVIGEGPEELLEPRAISLTETPAARGPFHAGTSPQAQDTVPRPAPAIQVPLADVATPSHTAGVVDLASAPTRPVFSAPPVAIAPGAPDAAALRARRLRHPTPLPNPRSPRPLPSRPTAARWPSISPVPAGSTYAIPRGPWS